MRIEPSSAFTVIGRKNPALFGASEDITDRPRNMSPPTLEAARIGEDRREPLFRRSREPGRRNALQEKEMSRLSAFKMFKRRARKAGLPAEICAHSFRGTGITEYCLWQEWANRGHLWRNLVSVHQSPWYMYRPLWPGVWHPNKRGLKPA